MIVILGSGLITPLGRHIDTFFRALKEPMRTNTNAKQFNSTPSCNVLDFDVREYYSEDIFYKLDRNSTFAICSARAAIINSGKEITEIDKGELGIFLGTSTSIASSMSDFDETVLKEGPRRCDIGIFPSTVMCAPASRIAIAERITGPNTTFSSGTNSGLDAIGYAFVEMTQNNRHRMALAGGCDALSPKIIYGLEKCNLLVSAEMANKFPMPVNKFIPSEGACFLFLENIKNKSRHVKSVIAAFNSNFYSSKDALKRNTFLHKLIEKTLKDASLSPRDIDYILLSSCQSNSMKSELDSLNKAFNLYSNSIPMLALKKKLGEPMSSFGPLQVMFATEILNKPSLMDDSFINFFNVNDNLKKIPKKISNILILGVDIAGHNSCLVVSNKERCLDA